MRLNGHLDNTLLLVMADHGARFTAARRTTQGKLEGRLAMMSLTFPERFKVRFAALLFEMLSPSLSISLSLSLSLSIYIYIYICTYTRTHTYATVFHACSNHTENVYVV